MEKNREVYICDPIIPDIVHHGVVVKTFWIWSKVEIYGCNRSRWVHNSYLYSCLEDLP